MKRSLIVLMVVTLLAFASMATYSQTFEVDANHSNIGFSIPLFGGLSEVGGKFSRFEATTQFSSEDPNQCSIQVTIEAASIDTGIDQRDAHLRTADFFDVEKFPEITFISSKVEQDGDHLKVTGVFSMHGVSKEIILMAKVKKVEMPKRGPVLSVSLSATLNRLEFGIGGSLPKPGEKARPSHLGNEITIQIRMISNPPKPPEPKAEKGAEEKSSAQK